jgi:hypothetical protein
MSPDEAELIEQDAMDEYRAACLKTHGEVATEWPALPESHREFWRAVAANPLCLVRPPQ